MVKAIDAFESPAFKTDLEATVLLQVKKLEAKNQTVSAQLANTLFPRNSCFKQDCWASTSIRCFA